MARQKLVREFVMGEIRPLGQLTLSDASKLIYNYQSRVMQLQPIRFDHNAGKSVYSLDTDLYCTIASINPLALKQWLGFCALPRPDKQPTGTSLKYKLNDGTNDRYWDGGAWSVAGASDWNTEAEVAANIATYPVTSQTISVVINFVTTDKYATPSLYSIGLLLDCEIEYLLSLIEDTFLVDLKSALTTSFDLTTYGTGQDYLSLSQMRRSYAAGILTVTAVYDHTNDPGHDTNLYSVYNSDTQEITLTTAIGTDDIAWVEYEVVPVSHLNFSTSQYTEVASYPSVVADGFVMRGHTVYANAYIWNVNDDSVVIRRRPHWMAFDFRVVVLAGDQRELLQLMERMIAFSANGLLRWKDLDQDVTMVINSEAQHNSRASLVEAHQAEFRIMLRNVYFWLEPEDNETLVQRYNLTFVPQEP